MRVYTSRPSPFAHHGTRPRMVVNRRYSRTMCTTSTWMTSSSSSASGTPPVCARPRSRPPLHADSSLQSVLRPGRVRPLAFAELCGNTCHHALFLGTWHIPLRTMSVRTTVARRQIIRRRWRTWKARYGPSCPCLCLRSHEAAVGSGDPRVLPRRQGEHGFLLRMTETVLRTRVCQLVLVGMYTDVRGSRNSGMLTAVQRSSATSEKTRRRRRGYSAMACTPCSTRRASPSLVVYVLPATSVRHRPPFSSVATLIDPPHAQNAARSTIAG